MFLPRTKTDVHVWSTFQLPFTSYFRYSFHYVRRLPASFLDSWPLKMGPIGFPKRRKGITTTRYVIALKKAALIPLSFSTAGSELYHSGTKVPVKSLAIFLHKWAHYCNYAHILQQLWLLLPWCIMQQHNITLLGLSYGARLTKQTA